jgi:hypothetical protein
VPRKLGLDLLAAREAYCDAVAPAYDDVLHAVTDRVAQRGSLEAPEGRHPLGQSHHPVHSQLMPI